MGKRRVDTTQTAEARTAEVEQQRQLEQIVWTGTDEELVEAIHNRMQEIDQTGDSARGAEIRKAIEAACKPNRTTTHRYHKAATVSVTRNGSIRRIGVETTGGADPLWLAVHLVSLLLEEIDRGLVTGVGPTDEQVRQHAALLSVHNKLTERARVSQLPKGERPTGREAEIG